MGHPCQRVLVVNDNVDTVNSLRDVLELSGFSVATAITKQEVERVLASGFRPNAVIVDLRLGGGQSGEAIVDRLRRDPAYSDVAVVVMSGDVHGMQSIGGVDARLAKPFGPDELLRVLGDLCS